jgi:thioesterase domain-containing protein
MLLTRVKESEGVDVSFLQFAEEPTVTGLCRLVEARSAQPAHDKLHVVVRPGDGRPALFCVPGSYGNMAGFFQLARRMGLQQAVTLFRLPAWSSGYRVEDLAARYVADVVEAQPHGPYQLAGVCTGGFVVYEMARQLRARGEEVGLLALFDCYNHRWAAGLPAARKLSYRAGLLGRRFLFQKRNLGRVGFAGALRYLRPKLAALLETTRFRLTERAHRLVAGSWKTGDARLAVRLAAARYEPRLWPGKLDLFRVEEPHVDAYDYPQMGWAGLAEEGIAVHDIAGNHLTMFAEPQVQAVAEVLLDALRPAAVAQHA